MAGCSTCIYTVPRQVINLIDSLQPGQALDLQAYVLVRNTTWTSSRDTTLGLNFTGVNYYDGQGFMINKKKLKIASALDLHEEYESAGFARPQAKGERGPRPHASGGPKRRRYSSGRSRNNRW